MKRALGIVLALVVLVALSSVATAQEALHPARLDPSWKGLPFGGNRDQVLEVLKRRISDRYGALIRDTLDVRDRDRLSRDMRKEIEDVEASRIVFDQTQTAWNVSILRDEFAPGDEMILVREGNARFYLLFHEGKFYKLAITPTEPARDPNMASLEATYGKPGKVETEGHKEKHVALARWTDAGPLSLAMQDFTRQFQTVLVRWAVKDVDDKLRSARKGDGGPALNPLIKEAQAPEEAGGVDPVDDLIGKRGPVPAVTDKPARKPRRK